MFKQGKLLNAYASAHKGAQVVSLEGWEEHVNEVDGAFTLVAPLSTAGLMVSKLLLTGGGVTEILKGSSELSEYLGALSSQSQPSAVQLIWNEASAGVFYPGGVLPPYSLYISRYTVLNGPGIESALAHRREANCRVAIHAPDLDQDAWREFYLKKTFQETYQWILTRFENLTGRALADSLSRLLALHAVRQNLQISITDRVLDDQEVFPSPQAAGQAYRQLLSEIFNQFSTVVGPGLLKTTIREILSNLPERERMVARSYELFPGEFQHE